ncbi:hypothetical protein LIER_26778 [Lithospermum erythrorhizon]|uniref:Reverse transcriptase domain-containing protein n=1 Tax=Lithospermum erythrorhizon TaxID=34254 RepID=A0AAV3RDT6_LITER
MPGSKSPGPDGISTIFFQQYWDIVGPVPNNITQFRPITLCNVAIKIINNVLPTRLKTFLSSVISDSQSSFVPRILITNNIPMAYEAHHYIKNQKQGRKGLMSIKLDMLKAYDRIEWAFLWAMLYEMGFSEKWIHIIMSYVESLTYSLLINGDQIGHIKPGRGLRQDY